MTTTKLKTELERLFKEHPIRWMKCIINSKNKEWHWLEDALNSACPLLTDPIYKLHTKIFWVLNGMTDFPKCEVCGNPVIGTNVVSCFDGYRHLFCSKKCRYITAHKAAVETNIKKYGAGNPMQNKEVSSKSAETQRSFTSEQKQAKREKRVATCMEKYGTTNGGWSKEAQDKIHKHFLEKYGNESWVSTEEFKNKVRQTCRERYGSDSWFGSDEFRGKLPGIIMEKYGVENVFVLPEVQWKQKQARLRKLYRTLLENAKVVSPLFSEEELLDRALKNGNSSMLQGETFLWKCHGCGQDFESEIQWNSLHHRNIAAWCPTCFPPLPGRSKCERELAMFIETVVPPEEVRVNVKDIIAPLELDIYIPSKKLAFEFDGLFYHSESQSHPMEKNYHINKTELCEKLGIHLVHVFENEWRSNREIVESKIRLMLNGGSGITKIGARECEIDERIPKDELVQFLNANHLQGSGGCRNGDIAVGLRLKNGELVSVMTFSKPRFDKKHEWELVRFCSKLNCHVSGAASRMLSHFEHTYHPENIVTYADRRWTMNNGNTVYDKLGFKLDHISAPNYWYWKDSRGMTVESRMKYQKHKLSKILETFDSEKSEIQNMLLNGFHLIYDCGNLVYVKEYT